MRPITRSEIVDYMTYNDGRAEFRAAVLASKRLRRFEAGAHLCLMFENRQSVRYQVQEMMRVERIVREADIAHELETYNELLGGPGELRVTLLIGIEDEALRDELLPQWLDLNGTLYAELPDGTKVRPTWDERQVGKTRLSAVQYLSFRIGPLAPVAVGCDHADPRVAGEHRLSEDERAALQADLDAD